MQWSPFLFILMDSFLTCQQYEYHFIEEEKTWNEAQKYCRDNYTDLATVYNMTDMRKLCEPTENQKGAWIGLHNLTKKIKWHIGPCIQRPMLSPAASATHMERHTDDDRCLLLTKCNDLEHTISPCTEKHGFICYDEKDSSKKLHLINKNKTWLEAERYCRKRHMDMVSGLEQLEVEELINKMIKGSKYWVGDTWMWSDGSLSSFRHWKHNCFDSQSQEKKCAMTMLDEDGRWETDDCNKTKSFFCYDDEMILIKENKTWEEALYYCREKYHDLVSITNHHQQRWVQERAKKADSPYVWLGLRYTCTLEFWFWVSDDVVSYENWASPGKKDECDMSGAMERGGEHQWFSRRDNETFNFICSR